MAKKTKSTSGKVGEFVAGVEKKYQAAKERLHAAAEPMKWVAMRLVATVEVTAMAFGFGWMRAYYGEKSFLGLPVDAWTGIGLNVLGGAIALSSKSGKKGVAGRLIGENACNLGNGALACWSATAGAGLGAEAKSKKDQAGGAGPAPSPMVAGYPQAMSGWGPPSMGLPPGTPRGFDEELTAAPGMVAAGMV